MGYDYISLIQHPYVRSLLVFLTCVVLAKTILYLTKVYIANIVNKHKSVIDNIILRKLRHPISWLIIILGVYFSLVPINVDHIIISRLIKTAALITIIHIMIIISDVFIDLWRHKWRHDTSSSTFDDDIVPLFHNFIKIILLLICALILLHIWGVQVGPLMASLGIIGIIIGFSIQGSLGNVLGGISLVFDRAFKIGDLIKLESGELGEVVRVGLRSTSIKTFDNEIIIIPNNQLSNSRIINYAQPDNILRIAVPVSVVYGSDVDEVKKVLLDCIRDEPGILATPRAEARFIKMNDFSLDFNLIFYIENYKRKFTFLSKINSRVYKTLKKNAIGIPFPTRTIYMGAGKKNGMWNVNIKKKKTVKKAKKKVKKRQTGK